MSTAELVVTIISSALASSGLWSFVNYLLKKHDKKKDGESAEAEMLRGLGHDRICYLGEQYISNGYITKEEYENLNDYLYVPYKKLGGNGTAEKIMKEVDKLPIKDK